MFAVRKRPLLVVEERLLALRLSLNTPVVATAEIAPAPARAAILAYAEGGRPRFAVVVRSLRSGAAVVYELEDENLDEQSGWAVALDASLSFGESMGFLFDDEVVVDRRPETLRQAVAPLRDLLAPPPPEDDDVGDESDPLRAQPAAPAGRRSLEDTAEILLEDALDLAAEPSDEPDDAEPSDDEALDPDEEADRGSSKASVPIAAPSPPAPLRLSKFRAAGNAPDGPVAPARASSPAPTAASEEAGEPVPAAPSAAPASAVPDRVAGRSSKTLGRVRPLRRRASDAPVADPLARLLADF